MSKSISEIFDVEPVSTNLPAVPIPTQEDIIQSDATYAADNIRQLIEVGMGALKDAADVALNQESPRAYEVVSTMMKNLTDMNLQLMDIHGKKKDLSATNTTAPAAPGSVTNNAIFVGTTKDINELIMQRLQNGKDPV